MLEFNVTSKIETECRRKTKRIGKLDPKKGKKNKSTEKRIKQKA